MNRNLITYPHHILFQKAKKVEKFDASLTQLIVDMFQVMSDYKGVGLAAVQVKVPLSVIVYRYGIEEGYLINPTLLKTDNTNTTNELEGCLSFPDIQIRVPRLTKISVAYNDTDGLEKTLEAEGTLARIIQHEVDHLSGKTIADHLSGLRRDLIKRKMKKLQKQKERLAG